jgi:F-type H+-transporting ATPase subunit epsilon
MSAIYQLNVITPEKQLLAQDATFLVAPGAEGYFGVLPGHAPLVTLLNAGELSVGWGERPERYAVSSGYAEILPEQVTILVERAVAQSDIDVPGAEAELKEANGHLGSLTATDPEWGYWKKRQDFAQACLEVHKKKDK